MYAGILAPFLPGNEAAEQAQLDQQLASGSASSDMRANLPEVLPQHSPLRMPGEGIFLLEKDLMHVLQQHLSSDEPGLPDPSMVCPDCNRTR